MKFKKTQIAAVWAVMFVLVGGVYAADLTVPHTFSPGTAAKSSEVNENFDRIYSEVNMLKQQVSVFADDFESGLGAWTGKNGGSHSGTIVSDPIRPNNKVLTFTNVVGAGDIFTVTQFALDPNYNYVISFEYLGLPKSGSIPGDLGGYAGLSEDLPGRQAWYYGTGTISGATDVLVDDGKWHSYTYCFRSNVTFYSIGGGSGSNVHLMFEDVIGVTGDVFFDRILFAKTPVSVP
jgi:hypothetical protein